MSEEHIDCLKRWIKSDKNAAAPWVILASEYYRRGDSEQSERAWTQVFQLRGYVKIRCPKCKAEHRLPYDESIGFDITNEVQCDDCRSVIRLPENLARD